MILGTQRPLKLSHLGPPEAMKTNEYDIQLFIGSSEKIPFPDDAYDIKEMNNYLLAGFIFTPFFKHSTQDIPFQKTSYYSHQILDLDILELKKN